MRRSQTGSTTHLWHHCSISGKAEVAGACAKAHRVARWCQAGRRGRPAVHARRRQCARALLCSGQSQQHMQPCRVAPCRSQVLAVVGRCGPRPRVAHAPKVGHSRSVHWFKTSFLSKRGCRRHAGPRPLPAGHRRPGGGRLRQPRRCPGSCLRLARILHARFGQGPRVRGISGTCSARVRSASPSVEAACHRLAKRRVLKLSGSVTHILGVAWLADTTKGHRI